MFETLSTIACFLFPLLLIGMIVCPKRVRDKINKAAESNLLLLVVLNVLVYGSFGLVMINALH